MLVLAAYCLPFMLMTGVYTYRDSKRCGRDSVKWAVISAFGPCFLGFVVYLLTRDPNGLLVCANCGTPVKGSDTVCPNCGTGLRLVCPECGGGLEAHWKLCPHCGSGGGRYAAVTPPVRRTNRTLWQILLAMILVPVILVGAVGFIVNRSINQNHFLTRYNTQGELVDEFLDIAYYDTDQWHSFTRTNADGSMVSVKQGYDYRIERTASDGKLEVYNWKVSHSTVANGPWGKYADLNGEGISELAAGTGFGEVQVQGHYYRDDQGRINLYQLKWGGRPQEHRHSHYRTELRYDEQGRIVLQLQENEEYDEFFTLLELSPEAADQRYETYTYGENGKVAHSRRFNYRDELVGFTDYTWAMEDTIRISRSYDGEGHSLGYSISQFDGVGRLLRQEFFDGQGNRSYGVEFDYDPVSYLLLPVNMMTLAIVWCELMVVTVLILIPKKKEYQS